MLHFHLKACSKCHGDLALDEGDWLCLQCGTYYYTRLYRAPIPLPRSEGRIDDRSGDRRVKTISLLTSGAPSPSRFPDLPTTVSGFGGSDAFGPCAFGLAAAAMTSYDHR